MQTPRAKPTPRSPKAPRSGSRDTPTPSALLDAALAVFDKHGWPGYTVHAVVAESGISLGSLYHHFGSMDGLSAALYSRCMAALLDAIAAAALGQRSARGVVTSVVKSYLRFTATEPLSARFIHTAPFQTALATHAAAIAADKAPRMERIVAAIRTHARAGSIVAMPEPLLEMLIIGPVAEVARRFLAGVPGIDLEEAERLLPERVWRSVRA